MTRVLVAHGYKVLNDGTLSKEAEAVCNKVIQIHRRYDLILLVGGWDNPCLLPILTIDIAMFMRLTELGVPRNKLRTVSSASALQDVVPARDSMEEVDVIPWILEALSLPKDTLFDAIGIWHAVPRLRFLYCHRGANARAISAFSWSTFSLRAIIKQAIFYFITRFDPLGKGKLIQKNRKRRTLDISDKVQITPDAWK